MTDEIKYVSRAGEKLAGVLDAMCVDPAGWVCADFGCNVGGFTDCLIQRGAAKVYAVDTGYGALAWTMRQHERVEVMERTNVLHCDVPEAVDLVVIDVGWTPQKKVIPIAAKWIKPGGRIVSLLKPTFEYDKLHPTEHRDKRVPLTAEQTQDVIDAVVAGLAEIGFVPKQIVESSLLGKGGNHEYLLEFVLG
jgi:23S rRNA (cytidine1920-2'-O)/16S rRNA (cytidine1409-2'-O)-methyltransferase